MTFTEKAHREKSRLKTKLNLETTNNLCRNAPPLECFVRSHELSVSMRMHCTQMVMSLNTIYQLVFWSVSQTPLPALSSSGPFEATSRNF